MLLNTGTIGAVAHPIDGGYVLDLETAATWRGLFWPGEYYHYDVGRQGLPSAGFDGGYGQVAWTLTGETHRYNPQAGAYYRSSRPIPSRSRTAASARWRRPHG